MITVKRGGQAEGDFTGERFEFLISEAELELEHIHRYVMAARLIKGGRVLDAACGSGYGSNILADVADEVHGVDISETAVAASRAKYPKKNLTFTASDATDLPFDDGYFDVVVSFETLEHLAEQEALIAGFRRILKPGGLLIVSTPEKTNYNNALDRPNEFHVKELETDEFQALLARHFAHHKIVGQRVVFGSVVSDQTIEKQSLQVLRLQEGGKLSSATHYDQAMYLIALCSDGELPDVVPEIYEGSIPQNAMSSLVGGVKDRDETIKDLRRTNASLSEAAALSETLKRRQDELRQEIAELSARFESANAAAQRHERRLAQVTADRNYFNSLFVSAQNRFVRLQQTHQSLVTSSAQALADKQAELDKVLQQSMELQAQMSAAVSENLKLKDAAQTHEVERVAWDERLQVMQNRISAVTADRDAMAAERQQYAQVQADLEQRISENEALQAACQAAQQALEQRERDHSEQIAFMSRDIIAKQHYAESLAGLLYERSLEMPKAPLWSDVAWIVRNYIKNRHNPVSTFKALRYFRVNGGFDPGFYTSQIPGGLPEHIDPLRHYIAAGWRNGHDPWPKFGVRKYLDVYEDVRTAGIEPYSHYLRHGRNEGRRTFPSDHHFVRSGSNSLISVFPGAAPRDLLPVESLTQLHQAPVLHIEDRIDAEWPTQRDPLRDRDSLGLYDIRPEDAVPIEGRLGADFMQRFALLSDAPDFAGAVDYLNSMTPASQIAADGTAPVDASIVIPIYGQLAYTLGCLHSLLLHKSRYSFEIIIGDDQSPDESGKWLSLTRNIRYVYHSVNGGFIENCNKTSEVAVGKYIIMLNSDIRVVEGWLDELIGSFDIFPKAGLVGSKLFYDDGSLQEGGGIVWRDGSAWNYGRNDDPNRPRYCYAREIDYISGCSIALPTALWRDLGGFDTHYRPAYAEDSDLCFRVRQAGFETWYQPLSRVIHYEGKTSGTDISQGVKAYQVINKDKLYERWKDTLSLHRKNADHPWLERERKMQKRVLIVDATNPTPWMDAGSVTTFTTLKIYQALGYKVYFVPQDNFLYEPRQVREMQRLGIECAYAPYEVHFSDYMQKYGHLFDVVQIYRVGVAEKCLADVRKYAPQAKLIFHNMDLHFLRIERQAAVSKDPKAVQEAEKVKARELDLIRNVDCTIVHSPVEKDILQALTPEALIVVFPYMVDFEGTNVGFDDRKDIMFLGGYGHTPNVDAVEFFIEKVWPKLAKKLPEARYLVVGSKPTEKLKALSSDRIVVTGMVEDLQPWFDRAKVFAATIRYGAGIKGKVSTAMAYGVPVIATECAAEGMYLEDGETVILADTADEIVSKILELYNDEAQWQRLSDNSMEFVKKYNSFEMGVETVRDMIAATHVKPLAKSA